MNSKIGLPSQFDSRGNPIIDPTANVIALVEAQANAAEQLRIADTKYNDTVAKHINEMAKLRAGHSETLRISDLDRLDKTRQVDVLASSSTATGLAVTVQTLAKQTTELASTLATQTDNLVKDINSRIAELQKSSYQGAGKSSVADPVIENLVIEVRNLIKAQASGSGKTVGMEKMWGWIVAGIFLLFELSRFFAQFIKPS